jgi:hypothetical protein
MALDIALVTTVAWLLIGLAIAVWIFLDMKKNRDMRILWPVIGFLLSFIGLILYYFLIKARRKPQPAYPPKPEYSKPDYKMEAPAPAKDQPASAPAANGSTAPKKVEQVEGIPRCPYCGAAVSVHDQKCPRCGKLLK